SPIMPSPHKRPTSAGRASNRLAGETSPYLLQHAHNPVDWFPWGDEAFAHARQEEKPILLSVGYSACHWCHVMERESFEHAEIAETMNRLFVNVKVDREERPDVDAIYMAAVQALTGHGGWPMTVFLTPDGSPFYGGTYFPPEDRHGLPAFPRVLNAVADAYRHRRSEVEQGATQLRRIYEVAQQAMGPSGALDAPLFEKAFRELAQRYDSRYGGFEGAPKFPQTMALDFLLRHWRRTGNGRALEIAANSFRSMARGGIYDQIGGGFARYSVDAQWLVPHFEKMLYDNALLLRLGAHLCQATGSPEIRRVVDETVAWVGREMTSPSGGFFASLDADSEGEEGLFYLWTEDELHELLGRELARRAISYYGVTKTGNFEGQNILYVTDDAAVVAAREGVPAEVLHEQLVRIRETLYAARAKRIWPARDEKILAGWNALMLRALAEVARTLEHPQARELALANAEFLFRELVRDDRVFRVHKDGVTRINGMLEDHAATGLAALGMYELTFDPEWMRRAVALAHAAVEWFWDDEANAFFDTASDHEALITRPREITDNAVPSGTSLAVELLLRVAELTADAELRRRAVFVCETLADPMPRHPTAFGHLLGAAELAAFGAVEVAIAGNPESPDFQALARETARRYLPALVLAGGAADAEVPALLEGRVARDGHATAYVCRSHSCDAPVTNPEELGEQLERAAGLR
ncbi:MAG TPA: thioredoxin domain-containing protein, partial [Gemmatimonadaceae bacterium]|nr:thioredoxin domain-containing protein [Gemmatimonadaceae bacterium]